jgi:hypothetical protein
LSLEPPTGDRRVRIADHHLARQPSDLLPPNNGVSKRTFVYLGWYARWRMVAWIRCLTGHNDTAFVGLVSELVSSS